jgi:hypothetical protein
MIPSVTGIPSYLQFMLLLSLQTVTNSHSNYEIILGSSCDISFPVLRLSSPGPGLVATTLHTGALRAPRSAAGGRGGRMREERAYR